LDLGSSFLLGQLPPTIQIVATAALKRMWRNRNRNRQVPDSGNHHDAYEQRTAAFCHG